MQLTETTTLFARQMAGNGRSAHRRAAYLRDLRALSRWTGGDAALSTITPDHLSRFLISDMVLRTPAGDPRAAISVNRTKSALRSFFAFCVESGLIKENPARLIRSSPARSQEPATLSDADIPAIRNFLRDAQGSNASRDRLIFELLLGTGSRLGSLVGLNRGDVNLEACTLHITAKGGRRERAFLNQQVCGLLRHHLGESATQSPRGPNMPVFLSKSGCHLGARQIRLHFAWWLGQAGITRPFSIHSLRHTFATRLYRKTGDLYLVRRALRHRQIATTEIYTRVDDDALRRAVSAP